MITIDVYSEPSETSRMMILMKIVNSRKPLTILAKRSISEVWQRCAYASNLSKTEFLIVQI